MAVFWVVAPCSLVEVYQRFRGPSCLHHQGDETTRRYNPEDSNLRTHRRENLKSYFVVPKFGDNIDIRFPASRVRIIFFTPIHRSYT
jgi:hypothetical protein